MRGGKLSTQGTRYILDGLNRNVGIRNFRFSQNDLSSSIYEFSIKIAKILTRHQSLMHLDLCGTGLKKEEVLFIGMALSTAKSCIALHLTGNNLDYYERIFMRTLVNAKVSYHFRNKADQLNNARTQRERNQILELGSHDFDSNELYEFMKQWSYIDKQRLGLDEQINAILKDVDLTMILRQLNFGIKKGVERSSILQEIIEKIQTKMAEIEAEELKKKQFSMEFDFDQAGTILNYHNMSFYGKDGAIPNVKDLRGDEENEDMWVVHNALKIDRIKQNIDKDRTKRAKSAGELALRFMGFNKKNYDLMLENPMTGYMNEVIFTRILGQQDVYLGN